MRINVRVKPGSKTKGVVLQDDGSYLVRVTSPPVEGRANYQMLEILAEHFGCPKRDISILKGTKARFKIVEIL